MSFRKTELNWQITSIEVEQFPNSSPIIQLNVYLPWPQKVHIMKVNSYIQYFFLTTFCSIADSFAFAARIDHLCDY